MRKATTKWLLDKTDRLVQYIIGYETAVAVSRNLCSIGRVSQQLSGRFRAGPLHVVLKVQTETRFGI